jgi:hypothetical protein
MQFTVLINQAKALEWGMNAQQAMLFAFIYQVPSWARPVVIGEKTYYAISKAKIVEELPLLTDKADTAYRLLKALHVIEVIELSNTSKITLIRITEKGRQWNRSENSPSMVGKKSEVRSENSPTNQITSNQITSNQKASCHQQADDVPYEAIFNAYERILTSKPKVRIRDEARCKAVRSLWRKDKKFQSVEFWERYFVVVKDSQFLMSQKTFAFDWLMKPANFKKVAEGNYS